MIPTPVLLLLGAGALAWWLWPRRDQTGDSPASWRPPLTLPPPSADWEIDDMLKEATTPRGIRNNNPGNLIFVPVIKWDGQIGSDPSGKVIFDSPAMGIRAAVKNLLTYIQRYEADTVREIITRWAPSHENPTDAYMQFVADATAWGIDDPIAPTPANLEALIRAIGHFENGAPLSRWYSDAIVKRGVNLAFA